MNWKITECVLALLTAIVLIIICNKDQYNEMFHNGLLFFLLVLLALIFITLVVRANRVWKRDYKKNTFELNNSLLEDATRKVVGAENKIEQQEHEIKKLEKKIEDLNKELDNRNNQLKQFYYYLIISNTDQLKGKPDISQENLNKIMNGFRDFSKSLQQ